jgi:hypothetical protein
MLPSHPTFAYHYMTSLFSIIAAGGHDFLGAVGLVAGNLATFSALGWWRVAPHCARALDLPGLNVLMPHEDRRLLGNHAQMKQFRHLGVLQAVVFIVEDVIERQSKLPVGRHETRQLDPNVAPGFDLLVCTRKK